MTPQKKRRRPEEETWTDSGQSDRALFPANLDRLSNGAMLNDEPAFVDWCGLNVERADGMKRKKDPDTRSVQSAMPKAANLIKSLASFKPIDHSAQ